eukprot:467013-Pleurochrysis_carterae.AAC.2
MAVWRLPFFFLPSSQWCQCFSTNGLATYSLGTGGVVDATTTPYCREGWRERVWHNDHAAPTARQGTGSRHLTHPCKPTALQLAARPPATAIRAAVPACRPRSPTCSCLLYPHTSSGCNIRTLCVVRGFSRTAYKCPRPRPQLATYEVSRTQRATTLDLVLCTHSTRGDCLASRKCGVRAPRPSVVGPASSLMRPSR